MRTAEPNFIVRVMRPEEVETIRTWSTAEGWNPGLHDGLCFFATDPQGSFIGELDGQPVSCLSCVAYDDSFGFLGQYIVKPEFRRQGYGIRTWRAGMAHLGTRNVGLDGVLAQQGNYERSGFAFAHHHIRYPMFEVYILTPYVSIPCVPTFSGILTSLSLGPVRDYGHHIVTTRPKAKRCMRLHPE
jgi:hypothetical protein